MEKFYGFAAWVLGILFLVIAMGIYNAKYMMSDNDIPCSGSVKKYEFRQGAVLYTCSAEGTSYLFEKQGNTPIAFSKESKENAYGFILGKNGEAIPAISDLRKCGSFEWNLNKPGACRAFPVLSITKTGPNTLNVILQTENGEVARTVIDRRQRPD